MQVVVFECTTYDNTWISQHDIEYSICPTDGSNEMYAVSIQKRTLFRKNVVCNYC